MGIIPDQQKLEKIAEYVVNRTADRERERLAPEYHDTILGWDRCSPEQRAHTIWVCQEGILANSRPELLGIQTRRLIPPPSGRQVTVTRVISITGDEALVDFHLQNSLLTGDRKTFGSTMSPSQVFLKLENECRTYTDGNVLNDLLKDIIHTERKRSTPEGIVESLNEIYNILKEDSAPKEK